MVKSVCWTLKSSSLLTVLQRSASHCLVSCADTRPSFNFFMCCMCDSVIFQYEEANCLNTAFLSTSSWSQPWTKTCPVFSALYFTKSLTWLQHIFSNRLFHLCHVQEQWSVWFPPWSNCLTNKRGLRQHNLDPNWSLRWFGTHGCWLQLKLQPQSLCWRWSVKTERAFYCFSFHSSGQKRDDPYLQCKPL